jgi:hypothetical protein
MISIILSHIALIGFNRANVLVDAYKIKRALKMNVPKAVRHGINFLAYAIAVTGLIWWMGMDWGNNAIFCISAFCNRQISFDIQLNKRRGLAWDYVTTDNPPKAIMDRIEIAIFGRDGQRPVIVYSNFWALTLVANIISHETV